jgi:hypothetical protein
MASKGGKVNFLAFGIGIGSSKSRNLGSGFVIFHCQYFQLASLHKKLKFKFIYFSNPVEHQKMDKRLKK